MAGRIVVIGAGVGGLVAAMILAARGRDVLVVEKEAAAGGKLRTLKVSGRQIDVGPTVLTLRSVFEEIFHASGLELGEYVSMRRATVLARHFWSETENLDLFADRDQSADAIGDFAGAAAARGFRAFCTHARSVYETMNPLFIRAERPTPTGMVSAGGLKGLKGLWSSAPFTTLWDALGDYFPDIRLRQLFGRYATYCGSSPFHAPATLALIAHVEQEGVWLVDGGMTAFAAALTKAAEASGAEVRTGCAVVGIDVDASGRVTSVRLSSGESIAASGVVSNADVGALVAGEFGDDVRKAVPYDAMLPRSLSAATWAISADVGDFPLAHHTVFFSRSSKQEFADLFDRGRPPVDPTVYLCASDRTDAGRLNLGHGGDERIFSIVNAPADGGRSLASRKEQNTCLRSMLTTLERCGLKPTIRDMTHSGPSEFARLCPATEGAIYGMASHGWTASFRRPGVRSVVPGLYLAGGSVHPGAGLPMAALSGRTAALALLADQPLT
ncbi:MAG TPA: phytoene desaturase family protein [Hyphomicrobiaceae bacterium]|nr:phytoene desaturase family protein [Hyphomicrobiaceae bacterium]